MATALVDSVFHWRKKLDKDLDEDVILNVIRKLSKVPMTLEILQRTHIGKKIRLLSKRNDIVGEKALAVLRRWRDAFAAEESKTSKTSDTSKKENRASSKHGTAKDKTVNHHHKDSHHKHEHSSLSHNSSKQSAKESVNNCDEKKSIDSTSSAYNYKKKEVKKKKVDTDPLLDASKDYYPECSELFFPDKTVKNKFEPVNLLEQKVSQKRKLKTEEQVEIESNAKKLKTESHQSFVSLNDVEVKKSGEKKEKQSIYKDKSQSFDKSKSVEHSTDKHKTSACKNSKNKASNESKDVKNKSKTKLKLNCSEEFTSSEVRFEDCLGFNDIVTLKKKKSSKSQLAPKKTVSSINNPPIQKLKHSPDLSKESRKHSPDLSKESLKHSPDLTKESRKHSFDLSKESLKHSSDSVKVKLDVPKPTTKLDVVNIMATLPEPQPYYRPLPRSPEFYSPKKKEILTNEDAIRFTSSRREKTAVYSGKKGGKFLTEVPSLFEMCTRVLIENVEYIECMGNQPYWLVKPILERCTPKQLLSIEDYNPDLLDDTNELWEIHCKRDYKLLQPEENETWRDLYWRASDERDQKLKNVTANIWASMSKSTPVRQVKMAFVDSIAKPPREVARRQAKNGTARAVNTVVKAGPPSKATPRPPAPIASTSTNAPFIPKKPKVAPLMAKTLKSMKQCFRR